MKDCWGPYISDTELIKLVAAYDRLSERDFVLSLDAELCPVDFKLLCMMRNARMRDENGMATDLLFNRTVISTAE